MVGVRRLPMFLAVLLIVGTGGGVVGSAFAAEWPAERRFLLVESPVPLHLYPPPSSVVEAPDGALLVLLYWPVTRTFDDGSTSQRPRTRLVRVAVDGSRSFVPPFGELVPGSRGARINVDDEILALPDGSILFSGSATIDVRRRDGSITRVAGIGRHGFSGDGGPATTAEIGFARGLSRRADGSILFGDGHRVRQIAPDGTITTVAGTGEYGFGGDGGPATAAQLAFADDVLATEDGGFLIADSGNGRVRRVSPDGVISTVAGSGPTDHSFGDGGPATAAGLRRPRHLGRLPDGTLLIGEWQRIRRVSADGTIGTVFDLPVARGKRLGDFAGPNDDTIEALGVTAEGGIAVIVGAVRLPAYYLAPRRTRRVLVGLRDARTSQRRVKLTVDATRRGKLQLEVRRRGKLVARAARHVRAGRQVITVGGHFAPAYHDVRVTLRAKRGTGHHAHVRLFTSRTLPARLVIPTLGSNVRCQRINRRRIDCEIHDAANEENGVCLNTSAYRLFSSGLLFTRPYGPRCHRRPIPFDHRPNWTAPWHPWPLR